MEKLADFLKAPLPRRSRFTSQAQLEGGEAAQKMGAKTDRDYAQVVRLYKLHPDAARRAYSFTIDASARKPLALFFWKARQLLKPSL